MLSQPEPTRNKKPTSFLSLHSELHQAILLESWNNDHLVELEQKESFYDWILHRIQFQRWAVSLREVSPHISMMWIMWKRNGRRRLMLDERGLWNDS